MFKKCVDCKTNFKGIEDWKVRCIPCLKKSSSISKIKRKCNTCDETFIGEKWKKECFACYNTTPNGAPITNGRCDYCNKGIDYLSGGVYMCMNLCENKIKSYN